MVRPEPGPAGAGRFRACGGKQKRWGRNFHLRFDDDGARLIVDGTRIVNLNREAALIVDLLLAGNEDAEVLSGVEAACRVSDASALRRDMAKMKAMLGHLAGGEGPCPFDDGGESFTFASCGSDRSASLHTDVPLRADLALTYGCSNDCGHCYSATEPQGGRLDEEQWEHIIVKLKTLGVPYLCFTGGEPTLYPGLAGLVEKASAEGLLTGLLTNGRRLSDRTFARALCEAGLEYVQVTLESCDESVHNAMVGRRAWHETVAGIRQCADLGMVVVTNTTITPQSIDLAAETAGFAVSLGARTVAANTLIRTGKVRRDALPAVSFASLEAVIDAMASRVRRSGARFLWYSPTPTCLFNPMTLDLGASRCSAASGSMAVDPAGRVLPCQSFFLPAGSMLDDDWDGIWNGPVMQAVRQWRSRRPECEGCPDLDLCRGGCPLEENFDMELGRALGPVIASRRSGQRRSNLRHGRAT
jgi:radical SAM protein with 4Fe4S-binding SPASM domain